MIRIAEPYCHACQCSHEPGAHRRRPPVPPKGDVPSPPSAASAPKPAPAKSVTKAKPKPKPMPATPAMAPRTSAPSAASGTSATAKASPSVSGKALGELAQRLIREVETSKNPGEMIDGLSPLQTKALCHYFIARAAKARKAKRKAMKRWRTKQGDGA